MYNMLVIIQMNAKTSQHPHLYLTFSVVILKHQEISKRQVLQVFI